MKDVSITKVQYTLKNPTDLNVYSFIISKDPCFGMTYSPNLNVNREVGWYMIKIVYQIRTCKCNILQHTLLCNLLLDSIVTEI